MSSYARADREKMALYAALAVTGTIAAGAMYYAAKNVYDNYIPYQVRPQAAANNIDS